MKYATRHGKLVFYWGKPDPTEIKRYREPVKLGERLCKWWACAAVRKWIYNVI